jgi:hypothetical protein
MGFSRPSILKLLFLHELVWYPPTRSEKFQIVACDNYDGFQHLNFVFFKKKSFHYFKD